MTNQYDRVVLAWQHLNNLLRHNLLPNLQEARSVWQLEREVPNFIRGLEGAPYDCGLIIEGPRGPELTQDSSWRFSDAIRKYEQRKAGVALLDFKTVLPVMDKSWKGFWCYYALSLSPDQRDHCTALIVQNPIAPHLVALVPIYYLVRGRVARQSYLWTSTAHPLHDDDERNTPECLPMSFAPFTMPVTLLPQALHLLDLFCRCPGAKW